MESMLDMPLRAGNSTLTDLVKGARSAYLVVDGIKVPLDVDLPTNMNGTASDVSIQPGAAEVAMGSSGILGSRHGHAANAFRLVGNVWELRFDGQRVHIRNAVGLCYIHLLLARPGKEILASALIRLVHGEPTDCHAAREVLSDHGSGALVQATGFRDEMLPPKARRRLEVSAEELHGEIESLRESGQPALAEVKEEELEEIQRQLNQQQYHGQSATFADAFSRARISVTVAILRARRAIAPVNRSLAQHIQNSIKTGSACCYQPESRTEWLL